MSDRKGFEVDQEFMDRMTGLTDLQPKEIVRDALSLLHWALQEKRAGRVVASMVPSGTEAFVVKLPAFDKMKRAD